MLKTRSILIFFATGSTLAFLTGCAPQYHSADEKYYLITSNKKVTYWQTALQGLSRGASEMKVKAEMGGPDAFDVQAEHTEFQRVLGVKPVPSGIMVSAADPKAIAPDIHEALSRGIPVITIDADAPASERLFFIGTDNYDAGTLGGETTAKLLHGKGNVVIFTIPTQANLVERLHGYQSAFEGYPGIKITQIIDMKGDPNVAFDTTRQLITSKAKIDAFVCLEAIACPEIGEILDRNNMGGKVTVMAMDTDQRTLDWIKKGTISSTIAQKPYTMAYYGIKLLDDLHHHKPNPLISNWAQNSFAPIPTFVDTGASLVNKDNIGNFATQNQSATTQ